ncbi:MAG: stage II sporulation protein R, partial [Clostridia bacterium]|nr:stage II sporulation protein R [Clostridia bacterium]
MKKLLAVLCAAAAVIATVVFVSRAGSDAAQTVQNDYLRIHVRANSNSQTDQSVKYIVKDEVVKYITPYAAQCTDKATAMQVISVILGGIEKVSDRVLREHG